MNVIKKDETVTIALEGRLDTITAPELAQAIEEVTFKQLIIDLQDLQYISSAGLRALLTCKKTADERGGTMIVKKPCKAVFEVMRMSGFTKMLQIEMD